MPSSAGEAIDQMQYLQRLKDQMTTAGALLDDCNEQQSFFTANHVLVPSQCLSKLEDLNTRMKLLQIAIDERHKVLVQVGGNQLSASMSDNGRALLNVGPIPNLATSVKSPWERATTPANVPYYIKWVCFIFWPLKLNLNIFEMLQKVIKNLKYKIPLIL